MSTKEQDNLRAAEGNVGQQHYNDRFNSLTSTPDMRALDDQGDALARDYPGDANNASRHTLAGAEQASGESQKQAIGDTAAGKVAATVASTAGSPALGQAVKILSRLRSRQGIGVLIAAVIIGIVLIATQLLGPALVLMNFKEILSKKFDDVSNILYERSEKIIVKKLSNDTVSSSCTIRVKCRYQGFSKTQIKNFERASWKVNTDGKKLGGFGYAKVTSLVSPSGKEITAQNLRAELKKDPQLRKDLFRAYNPKVAGLSTRFSGAMKRVAAKLKVSQAQNITGDTKEEYDEKLKQSIDGTVYSKAGKLTPVEENGKITGYTDEAGNTYSVSEGERILSIVGEVDANIDKVASSGGRAIFNITKSTALSSMTAGLGVGDTVCTVYGLVMAVGEGAKVITAAQTARFAYTVMNTADVTKASYLSNVSPGVVSYMSEKIALPDASGKNATDSYGYKYAAYGDTQLPSDATTEGKTARANILQFSSAGGLGAVISNSLALFSSYLGGAPTSVCAAIKNPWSQAGMFALGIFMTVFSGGTNIGVGLAVNASLAIALSAITAVALTTLQNTVAGTVVTKDITGMDAGNAATAGAGAINAERGQQFGLSLLTTDEVAEYDSRIQASTELYDTSLTSWYDLTNPSSVLSQSILPYIQVAVGRSLLELPQRIAAMVPDAIARPVLAAETPQASCSDYLYNLHDLAADPYCNLRWGLRSSTIAIDPADAATHMLDKSYIDPETGEALPGTKYQEFIETCVDRAQPMLSIGEEFQTDSGLKCAQSDKNYDPEWDIFRIFYIDNDVNNSMDETATELGTPLQSVTGTGIAPVTGMPPDATPDGKGWTLKENTDYSHYMCPDGSTDAGLNVNKTKNIVLRKCTIAGDAAPVASVIAPRVLEVMRLFKQDTGLTLSITGSLRTYEQQQALYNANCSGPGVCSPPTAYPGTSMHESGLAVDWGYNHTGKFCHPDAASPGARIIPYPPTGNDMECPGYKTYDWFVHHGAAYTFYKNSSESWHWSMNGK